MDETINYRNRKEDGEWSEKFLKLSVREAFNSAHEILAIEELILIALVVLCRGEVKWVGAI